MDHESRRQEYYLARRYLHRKHFPEDFIFGTGSSAYQFEGAVDRRGRNIWDTFTHTQSHKIQDKSTGDEAVRFYYRYKEDIQLMKNMGMDAFKLSISWSRILPEGKLCKGIDKEGIRFYNNLIDELLSQEIEPYVCLFHWDVPQALEDQYQGFRNPQIVTDFRDYADVCFEAFGDRVKHWITLNEPWSFSFGGYVTGNYAPGRCAKVSHEVRCSYAPARHTSSRNLNLFIGNCGTEPYWVSHFQLLAHAYAAQLYKHKYQKSQDGEIGISLVSTWAEPLTESLENRAAALRSMDFMLGWFMDPLITGDYPKTMQNLVKERLPKFTAAQSKMLMNSYDFIGLNYYTAKYAENAPNPAGTIPSHLTDAQVKTTSHRDGEPIGTMAASDWFYVYAPGIYKLLMYIKEKYNNPVIYITENGIDLKDKGHDSRQDILRVEYHYNHLCYIMGAIRKGVDVRGYFAWSFLDNFEWCEGYQHRFGLYFVDYKNGMKRYPKFSCKWFQNLLKES